MPSIFDRLQSLSQSRLLSEKEMTHLVKMNELYRLRLITYNELCIGLGGQRIGAAGDRFVSEERQLDRPRLDLLPQEVDSDHSQLI